MSQAASQTIINASADCIWRVIGDFGGACQCLFGVVGCTVERAGVGAVRTLTNADGSTIVERLESLDQAARQLSYALLTDTPFRNCLTTMAVRRLGPAQSELEWSATSEPDGLPEGEATDLMQAALAANGPALKEFVERGGAGLAL